VKGEPMRYVRGHKPRKHPHVSREEFREMYAETLPKGVAWGECFCGCGWKTKLATEIKPERFAYRGEPLRFCKGHSFAKPRTRHIPKPFPCEKCGDPFPKSWANRNQRFCSDDCRYDHKRGENNAKYNGGFHKQGKYRVSMVNGRRMLEHRRVMEEMLGRPLRTDEHVHHKDGDTLNNSPDNLEVMSRSEHARLHVYLRYG